MYQTLSLLCEFGRRLRNVLVYRSWHKRNAIAGIAGNMTNNTVQCYLWTFSNVFKIEYAEALTPDVGAFFVDLRKVEILLPNWVI